MTEAFSRHQATLLLIQLAGDSSRTYLNYSCLAYAFDELFNLFEDHVKSKNASASQADLQEFDRFVDDMPDLVIMLFDGSNGCFEAHSKGWIKQKAYEFLRSTTRAQEQQRQ